MMIFCQCNLGAYARLPLWNTSGSVGKSACFLAHKC